VPKFTKESRRVKVVESCATAVALTVATDY